ncbi:MAG TPA: zinc finger domain-containing protein, partial [Nitrospinota bacterium]|nr:zinc finger domain-containing protein [Nitrospinota bacterium]
LGSALNAKVKIAASEEFRTFLEPYLGNLPALFIVSAVEAGGGAASGPNPDGAPPWTIQVEAAEGEKCERCWMVLPSVGQNAAHPTLCGRCAAILE